MKSKFAFLTIILVLSLLASPFIISGQDLPFAFDSDRDTTRTTPDPNYLPYQQSHSSQNGNGELRSNQMRSSQSGSNSFMTLDANLGNHLWNETLTISGTAYIDGNTNRPYANSEIHLFFNISATVLDDNIKTVNLTQPEYPDYNYTTTTDGTGYYEFPVTFTSNQLGYYNYTVWYPMIDSFEEAQEAQIIGFNCFECAYEVDTGDVTVIDQVSFQLGRLTPKVIATDQQFRYRLEMFRLDNLPVPASYYSAFTVNYTVDFEDDVGAEAAPRITDEILYNDIGYFDAGNEWFQLEDFYTGVNDATAFVNFDVTQTSTIDFLSFAGFTDSDDFNLSTQFSFAINQVLIGGVPYTFEAYGQDEAALGVGPSSRPNFYRNNQTVEISGIFNSTSSSTSAENRTGNPVEVRITGMGADITNSTTTDSTGAWSLTFNLDWTQFTDLRDLNITVDVTTTDTKGWLDPADEDLENFYIDLVANASISAKPSYSNSYRVDLSGLDSALYYYQDGREIVIQGSVFDERTQPAIGVFVDLYVTDQLIVNASGPMTELITITNSTDINGDFLFRFITPDLVGFQQTFTVNVSLSTDMVSGAYAWNHSRTSYSLFTMDYLDFDTISNTGVDMILNGPGTEITGITDTITIFNDTYYSTYQGGWTFDFDIKDDFGRVPVNLSLRLVINEANGNPSETVIKFNTIDTGNNGIFNLPITGMTSYDTTLLGTVRGAEFSYSFEVVASTTAGNVSIISGAHIVTITGQDNTAPTQPGDLNFVNGNQTNDQVTTDDITVTLNAGNWGPLDFQNIRNVTIYYKNSTQGGFNITTIQNFNWNSVPWQIANMTLQGTIGLDAQFVFTIPFVDHGYFFQIRIVIYDLAGFGVAANGVTLGGNTWAGGLPDYDESSARPSYNHDVSNTLSMDNNGQPILIGMGDTSVTQIDPNQQVVLIINGVRYPITNGYNITTLSFDITVELTLPLETLGYSYVFFYYRFLSQLSNSGTMLDALDTSIPYIQQSMTSIGNNATAMVFTYTIPRSELKFSTILDFYFEYGDNRGNNANTTPFVSSEGNIQNQAISQVVDLFAPIEVDNNFDTLRRPNRNNPQNTVVVWGNETLTSFTVSYEMLDPNNGVGIGNISILWYVNGIFELEIVYATNGVYDFDGVSFNIGTSLIFNFTIPDALFEENTTIGFEIVVTDLAGNEVIFNAQGANANQFQIDAPPSEEGSLGALSNNALWIIAGFIGILALLTLYYQRHNIREILQRRARRKKVEGTLTELTDEIRRLGTEGKYRRAILLVWEALERVSREILQAPRKFNQTAKEFAAYLSTVTIVDRDTLLTLSATFQSARYGKDEPSEDEFDDAVKALDITVRTIIESGSRTRITSDDEDW